jgi:PKD repeat protein
MRKLFILIVLFCVFIRYGYSEQVEAGTTGNQIVFTLNNISDETISNAVITVETCPNWLEFNSESISIGTINAGASTDVQFVFSVSNTANGQGSVSFKINAEGVVWEVSSNPELNIPIIANPLEEMVANFTASTQTASSGTSIQFYDASSGDPTNYSWSFPGGSPSSSTLQNPVVTYANVGTYDVTLSVSGNGESDTETKTNFISIEINEFDIYGSVLDFYGNHSAIQGVTVEFIPNSNSEGDESGIITTDYNGEFTFSVSEGWQGDVLFSKDGYSNVSRTIGYMNSNYNLGEIMLQIVALDFTYEHTDETSRCVEVDIQTNVSFHHARFFWDEPISGGYSDLTYTRSHYLCLIECVNGETYSNNVSLCLYDIDDNQIGSCVENNISFYFEPVNMECYNVDIYADYEIENGGNVFPLGTTVKFNNTSYPQECVMTSVWWFDNEHSWDDCSWWDTHFNCEASCKYDIYHELSCSHVTDPDPYYVEHQYNSKGKKVIRLFVSSACNAKKIALGCDGQTDGFTDSDIDGGVIIVDCDDVIDYSSNLSSAVKDDYDDTERYYAGSFNFNDIVSHSSDVTRTEFVACNNIKMTSGFKITNNGKATKLYVHSNLIQGNLVQSNQKSVELPDDFNSSVLTSLDEQKNNSKFKVYPNPVCDELCVEVSQGLVDEYSMIFIYDVSGKLIQKEVIEELVTNVDVSSLTYGTYIISIRSKSDILYSKFVKDKSHK